MPKASRLLKTVLAIGVVESLALAVYGIAILANSLTSGTAGATGSEVSPWILFGAYLAFAGLIAVIVLSLSRGAKGARTPYLLTQAFAIVVAQTLVAGGEMFERVAGWGLIAIALAGVLAIIQPRTLS